MLDKIFVPPLRDGKTLQVIHVGVVRSPDDPVALGSHGKPVRVHVANFDVQAPDGSPHALGFSDPNLPALTDEECKTIRAACAELAALGVWEPPAPE